MLRFTRLDDKQVLARVMQIIEKENIHYDHGGLETLIFASDGTSLLFR